jgi:hypothetical protein
LDQDEKERILVFDHVGIGGELHIDREPYESEDNYCRRRRAVHHAVWQR